MTDEETKPKRYKITTYSRTHRGKVFAKVQEFETYPDACRAANKIHEETGVVVGIEEVKASTYTAQDKLDDLSLAHQWRHDRGE